MKVELEKVRLSMSALTDTVYVGTIAKDGMSFTNKTDVTNDFIKAVIDWSGGGKRTVTNGVDKWIVSVKKVEA